MAEHSRFQNLVAEAKKHITEISPQDAATKQNNDEAVVIDVREKDEWDQGHIPGAIHMSRGTIELDIEEKVSDPNAMIICHCGGGGRSALAAYLFYICKNHPFLDGNKRTAMMAAIVFLRLNGIEPLPDSAKWEKLMLDVAASQLDRDQTTTCLRKLLRLQTKPS